MVHRIWRAVPLGLLVAGMVATAVAQPPLTLVEDTLFKADGSRFTGLMFVEWKSFEASDTSNIATHFLRVRVVNGLLKIRLVPTTNASAGAHYAVRYVSEGKVQFSEYWAVPSSGPVRVRDIRIPAPPGVTLAGGQTQIPISDVVGLTSELNIRPTKGLNYTPSRAAIINANGELEGAAGSPVDCVRVDGTSGPCGLSGGGSGGALFVDGETPAGTVNGVNSTFTLFQAPNPASSLELYRNGVLQKQSFDYNLTGASIQFLAASRPQSGDTLLSFYRSLSPGGASPQILCSGSGNATSQTTATSLATCVIPANTLQAGDRVEIAYDYSHEGTANGFTMELRWDNTAVINRTAAAGNTQVSARSDAAIGASLVYLSAESWGSVLGHSAMVTTAPSGVTFPATIDFRGQMSAAGTDTITLRNFRVVRYPTVP